MNKLFVPLLSVLLSFSASAQTVSILANFTTDTASTYPTHAQYSEKKPVTQVRGKTRKIVKKQKYVATGRSGSWLTALYLRPAEQQVTHSTTWPMVPALMLEGTPSQTISTAEGPRLVRQLRKGDILYHYESSTPQVSAWEVRIVQRKVRRAEVPYSLVTKNKGFLFESMVASEP